MSTLTLTPSAKFYDLGAMKSVFTGYDNAGNSIFADYSAGSVNICFTADALFSSVAAGTGSSVWMTVTVDGGIITAINKNPSFVDDGDTPVVIDGILYASKGVADMVCKAVNAAKQFPIGAYVKWDYDSYKVTGHAQDGRVDVVDKWGQSKNLPVSGMTVDGYASW